MYYDMMNEFVLLIIEETEKKNSVGWKRMVYFDFIAL